MKLCLVAALSGLVACTSSPLHAADRWSVIEITKPNAAKVIDGEKKITFTVTDRSVIAKFQKKVRWYQLQITHPAGGNDCPEAGQSYFVTSDRKSIELGLAPFDYCTWEVDIEWKD